MNINNGINYNNIYAAACAFNWTDIVIVEITKIRLLDIWNFHFYR